MNQVLGGKSRSEFLRVSPSQALGLRVPFHLLCPESMLFLKSHVSSHLLQSVGTLERKTVPVFDDLTI